MWKKRTYFYLVLILYSTFLTQSKWNIPSAQGQQGSAPQELHGWPITFSGSRLTREIIVTDIDGDSKDEVIIGILNEVHIIDETGQNMPGWPKQAGDSAFNSVLLIAVGDIDGDSDKEILCTTGAYIYAWHFETGTLVEGWPVMRSVMDMVLGDFDDDPNDLEIGVATVHESSSEELEIYILNGDGMLIEGWPRFFNVDALYGVHISTGNIDSQNRDEIVVACHKYSYKASPIYVLHSDGQLASGWPIQGNGPFVSPPVLCNLDGGDDYEVVAATVNETHTGRVYAWKSSGVPVVGWPVSYNAFDLSVGDLDNDKQPEIIAVYSNSTYWADHLAVLNCNGTKILDKKLELRTAATTGNADFDVDSEIIIPTWNGELQVMDSDGQNLTGFPIYISGGVQGYQSATGDLDGNGKTEIIQLDNNLFQIHAFTLKAQKSDRPDWPMARHDERRSSFWMPPQTSGFDILEISGPLLVIEKSATRYTALAYFKDGSYKDVTSQADWRVDPCYADYAHFESGGVLVTHHLSIFKDITIHAEYVEGNYIQSASYSIQIRPIKQVIYVDDDSVSDPGPNEPSISDPDENGTWQHPFDSIREAVDIAGNGDKVIVLPGAYYENVDFMGKKFTLTSYDPNNLSIIRSTRIYPSSSTGTAIIASDGSILGLSILGGTGIRIGENVYYTAYSPTIRNCRISVSGIGIDIFVPYMHKAIYPTIENNIISGQCCIYMFDQAFALGGIEGIIKNNVFVGNNIGQPIGIQYRSDKSKPFLINNIFTRFTYGIELTYTSILEQRTARICYNNLYDNQENYHIDSPPTHLDLTGVNGNISVDPCFVDTLNYDYHLRQDSLCIDSGDPSSGFGLEPEPDGGRINMGAYGNTPEATSKYGLVLQSYNLVSRTRVDRTIFDYVFKMTMNNNSSVTVSSVYVELLDAPDNVSIIDNDVTFAYIEAGQSAISDDTFTLRVDRSIPIDPTIISWRASINWAGGTSTQQLQTTSIPLEILVGDITGDKIVNLDDLVVLVNQWLQPPGTPSADIAPAPAGDGFVNFLDFAVLAEHWLEGI